MELDGETLALCEKMGAVNGVAGAIHPDDFIFAYMFNHPYFGGDREKAIASYFEDGLGCATRFRDVIAGAVKSAQPSILEFASGYGRVTRHLTALLPNSEIVACDIHPEAVAFASRLGVPALQSVRSPADFAPGRRFDAVFALSFFSHIPDRTWGPWLKALSDQTTPGGVVVFTTHGSVSARNNNHPIDETGFFFKPVSEQNDLDPEEYGSTFSLFDYVYRHIPGDMALIRFEEAFWFGHQDLYVLRRHEAS